MLKCTPSRYTMRQCSCKGRCRHVSYWCVRLWLSRLIVLATSSDSQQCLSHFPHLVRAYPGHEHLCQPFGDVRFVATIALEDLCVELTFLIAGDLEIFDAGRRCGQIAAIVAIAIATALGAAFPPSHANECIELLDHHCFDHRPHGTLGQRTQVLMEGLLVWHDRQ